VTGARAARRQRTAAAALAFGAVLAGCGFADISIIAVNSSLSSWWVEIESPTSLPEWRATTADVVVAGNAFVPSGSTCTGTTGTIAPGYRIAWLNTATGQTGLAAIRLDCLQGAALRWDTGPIPLEPGSNPIAVTASDADGRAASDTLIVWRQ